MGPCAHMTAPDFCHEVAGYNTLGSRENAGIAQWWNGTASAAP